MSIRPQTGSFITKSARLALVAICALLLSGKAAQAQSKMKPIAVVAVNSIDSLFQDADFVGGLGGMPAVSAQYQPMLKGFTPGLDHSRPIGLIVQSDGMMPSGALCLPVTDLKQLLAVLQNFGVTSEEGPDGTLQIGAQGQTLFAKEVDGWALLSMMPQMLEGLPANPGELFSSLTKDYDLGIRVNVQNVPEQFKQMAFSQVQAGMEAGMQKSDEESDEQFEARKEIAKLQVEQIQQVIQDLNELTFGLSLDGEKQRAFFDFVYTAVAGSKLAEQAALNSDPKTDYAGFFQPDAAMMMSFASKVGESDVAQIEQMFGTLTKQVETAIDENAEDASDEEREIIKSAIADFMQAFKTTLEAGKMDGGAVLNVSPNSLSFVSGGFIGDPSKIESGLKKLTELAKEKESKFPGVNWNASNHSDVQFHTLNIPIPAGGDEDEENARKLFGETIDLAVGIGKQSVYFSAGRGCVEAIKGIIDTSAASPQKSVPPMEMTFALSQIMATVQGFADEDERAPLEMITGMLTNEANGRDHVRIVVQPIPNGARTRVELEEGVLRAIGMGAMAAQMQGAGAGGF